MLVSVVIVMVLVMFFALVFTSVAHFVSLELVGIPCAICRVFAAIRHMAVVAMVWVKAVVYMAMEIIMAMKPWTRTDECMAMKPLRAVVSVRCTLIG